MLILLSEVKKKKRKKERKRKVNWEAIKCDTQWKPQGQKKGLVGGDPGTRSRDSSQDLWWGDRALPQDASSRLLAPFRHRDKAGLQVTAHKSSSAPQRLIPHTERPETYLPSSSCQMFLSSFYLGFNQLFAEATWLLVFLGNQTPFKLKP